MNTNDGGARYVTVRLANETYGLPIEDVESVVRWEALTRLPRMPKFLAGLLKLRGNAIPVIDLRLRLDLPTTSADADNRIVILRMNGLLVGLIVEGVREVVWIKESQIETKVTMLAGFNEDGKDSYLYGVANLAEGFIILLDLNGILDSKETNALAKLEAKAKAA